jgi:hypothetical protein
LPSTAVLIRIDRALIALPAAEPLCRSGWTLTQLPVVMSVS